MHSFNKLIFAEIEPSKKSSSKEISRLFSIYKRFVAADCSLENDEYLSEVIYEIAKHPECLIAHIQRIYYCYRESLTDPLYAALADLLIVLNKRGKEIARRMFTGAASKLTVRQRILLKAALNGEIEDISTIEGNRFCIYSRGLSGTVKLIEKLNDNDLSAYDPLQLARDAVEYFQLEEAMAILEKAIVDNPERTELHEFLLELYKSTHNRSRYLSTLAELREWENIKQNTKISELWNQLNNYSE